MKKKNFLIFLIFTVLIFIYFFLLTTSKTLQQIKTNANENKKRVNEYNEKNITPIGGEYSIKLTPGVKASSQRYETTLSSPLGEIRILQYRTQENNLDEFIIKNIEMNSTRKIESRELIINDIQAKRLNFKTRLSYYLYADHQVFLLYTQTKELFNELDAIATSFQFLGKPTPPSRTDVPDARKYTVENELLITLPDATFIPKRQDYLTILFIHPEGDITINHSNTNYPNLKDFLNDSRVDYFKDVLKSSYLSVNGLNIAKFIFAKEVMYHVYTKDRVYHFSTSSPSLYDDLDQIAKSFQYT